MNTTIDTNGLAVTDTWTKLSDISATDSGLSDWTCQPVLQAGVVATFTGSGWTAARGQTFDKTGAKRKRVVQFVVSFASADEASAFILAAPQHWAACADRQFTLNTTSGNQVWTVGPVNNSGDTLSVNRTNTSDDTGLTCQRALSVANNVVIDVVACHDKTSPQSDDAVSIARQIARNVQPNRK